MIPDVDPPRKMGGAKGAKEAREKSPRMPFLWQIFQPELAKTIRFKSIGYLSK